MILWLDAQLSPALAPWLEARFGLTVRAVRDLGLRDASDRAIFAAARAAGAIVITKDQDFPELLARFGPPPQVLWLTCGNTSNASLRGISRPSSRRHSNSWLTANRLSKSLPHP